LVSHRRYLHRIPELGLHLPQTSAYVEEKLKEMGYEPERVGESGLVAVAGKKEGRCFLIRGDMDALPVEEESGVEFSSTNGRMHACGHDCHISSMLGAAQLLKMHEDEIEGQVKLVFQPGEETMEGGEMMVKAGILRDPDVDAALGIHIFTNMNYPAGTVMMMGAEGLFAAIDWFNIHISGQGSHGAQPNCGVDPINVMAHIKIALQAINARELDPTDNLVLTIGHAKSGNIANVIPGDALLSGTIRTVKNETRFEVKKRVEAIVKNTAAAFRAEASVEWGCGCPVLNNDKTTHDNIKRYLRNLEGLDVIDFSESGPAYRTMISEDYAYISSEVPSTYLLISGGKAEDGYCYPQHHPKALFNEDAIPVSAAVYAHAAIEWLKEHK
ncbi:MAG: amidohydrolase, partial [Oscillospiraceae bacterium]|nr:amidohydrolase [Oscillospiraceae bacterium]